MPLRVIDDPRWFRGHKSRNAPLHFNQERGRFRVPGGTLYLGASPHGAFVEAFSQRLAGVPYGYIVSQGILAQSCLCLVTSRRPMRLVDLTTGQALRRLAPHADARIATGRHALSQRWANAFWSHPDQPDGILYPCRRAPEVHSIALFDRTRDALVATCTPNLLHDSDYLAEVLDHYDCALVP